MLRVKDFSRRFGWNLLAVCLLGLTFPLFFYKLGQSSLGSWDEAWYADIARNILLNRDFFYLTWNGSPFFDHPPLGFWLTGLVFALLGVNEFSARFVSALLGFLSLFVVYFLGSEVFNRRVGFAAALAFASSTWFLYRARSGNLDSVLTFFFILTFLWAFKSIRDQKFLVPFTISLMLLFLTKTLVPVTILPSLILVFLKEKKVKIKYLVVGAVFFFLGFGGWFMAQALNYPNFVEHFLAIGFPQVNFNTSYVENLNLAKTYLHSGIGKWFWPAVVALPLGLFFFQKKFVVFFLSSVVFFLPIMFSSKIQIWHLIPLFPLLILNLFGCLDIFLRRILVSKVLVNLSIFTLSLGVSLLQIKQNWMLFIDIPSFVSDEAILSKEAGKYPYEFFVDGDFDPVATFYSGKPVQKIYYNGLVPLFSYPEPFLLITTQGRLDEAGILKERYRIIKTDRDKILVVKEEDANITSEK